MSIPTINSNANTTLLAELPLHLTELPPPPRGQLLAEVISSPSPAACERRPDSILIIEGVGNSVEAIARDDRVHKQLDRIASAIKAMNPKPKQIRMESTPLKEEFEKLRTASAAAAVEGEKPRTAASAEEGEKPPTAAAAVADYLKSKGVEVPITQTVCGYFISKDLRMQQEGSTEIHIYIDKSTLRPATALSA